MNYKKFISKLQLNYFWEKVKTWGDSLFALDSEVVHKSNNETINGTKTFSNTISGSINGNANTATTLATARALWGNNFDGSAAITGTISGVPCIEFKPSATTSNNGGYLDFHYNQSTADYTSRIIESASGTLNINNVTITTGKVVTATTFTGALTGNVTGNVSGSSGSCTGNSATATKLATARSLKTKLDSTTAVTFDGSAAQDAIPVTGTLPIANGGTGSSTKNFVDLSSAQTVAGVKTFSSVPVINTGAAPAAGALSHIISAVFKNTDKTQTHTIYPISFIGNSQTENAYNSGVRLGSLNGTTIVTAGESGANFATKLSAYDNENLYLDADNEVHIYVKCANDMATYAGPIKFSGSANASGGTTTVTATTFVGALTGNCSGSSGSCTGNAASATKLATARTINGVSFNGTANITVADSTKLPLAGGTLTGNVTMKKAGPTFVIQNTDYKKGTNPSATKYSSIPFVDNAGTANANRIALLEAYVDANGQTCMQMGAYKYTSGTTTWTGMGIRYTKDGTSGYTFAPTPATGDNSTKIATTAFVKAQGYKTGYCSYCSYCTNCNCDCNCDCSDD